MTDSSDQPPAVSYLRPPIGVTTWIIFCATMSVAGWLLSAIHQLNAVGYVCVALVMAVIFWPRKSSVFCGVLIIRRPLPLAYFLLATLVLLGGLLYAPENYDALAYRVPRVLHWLAHGQWHWVHTAFPRLNDRACGQEWLMAPVIAITGSARLTWIFSFITFLLLPGLFFSVFTRFGVRPRIAWYWMWIAPAACCYATQAGGIANDLLGAGFALAAFDFALRFRKSGRSQDFWLFALSAALLTNAKASNLLLALPLFLVVCPRWRIITVKPAMNALIITAAILCSFVPVAFFNWKYSGDWTGMRLEGPMKPYVTQFGINSVNSVIMNFAPPIFPFAEKYAQFLRSLHLDPDTVRCWRFPELTTDGDNGLGIGIFALLIIGTLARIVHRKKSARQFSPAWKLIVWSPYISLFVFLFKAQAVNSVARLLTPYWPALMVAPLVFWFDADILKRRWWHVLSGLAIAVAIMLVVLTPDRPLWPARTILGKLKASHPNSHLIARAQAVYEVYGERANSFAPLVAELPKDATVFGMVTFDDPESSLWWPFRSRRIEHVTSDDTPADLTARGIKYILAPTYCGALSLPVQTVIQKYNADVVKKIPLTLRADSPNTNWYILKINPPINQSGTITFTITDPSVTNTIPSSQ